MDSNLDSRTYNGSCHCGAIQFSFSGRDIDAGLRCNCSICRRKGALMSRFALAPELLEIRVEADCLSEYRFGAEVAKHYFCKRCGIYTFHQTRSKPGHYRINLGCVDGLDIFALASETIDGAALA